MEFIKVFLLLSVVVSIASLINHIDDTDETYGYWEPLHYLLYGKGMQTWEYSPQYAIRSYTFIYPMFFIGKWLKALGIDKIYQFYILRYLLGLFNAYALSTFYCTLIKTNFFSSTKESFLFFWLCLTSSGIFFASTAYLPSAVSMSLLLLSYSYWLQLKFERGIFWGSLAVLWTGWPFVGVLLAPIGLHMISYVILTHQQSIKSCIFALSGLIINGLIIVSTLILPAMLIDYHYYHKITFPTLNILLYNAIGGSGDELYGIEPISYYLKNLLLNTGFSWIITLLYPLIFIVTCLLGTNNLPNFTSQRITLYGCVLLWLGILFSRPHKEERFLYPIYPLLSLIATDGIVMGLASIDSLFQKLGLFAPTNKEKASWFTQKFLKRIIYSLSMCLFVIRILANYKNYHGYISLWKDTSSYLTSLPSITQNNLNNIDNNSQDINVCVGIEWYQFPSHFFLPNHARLAYIDDGFHGILPQHFASINGTFGEPLQPFNDQNKEETIRYIPVKQCDYLIHSRPSICDIDSKTMSQESCQQIHSSIEITYPVVDSVQSGKEFAKAYALPYFTKKYVNFKDYTLNKITHSP